MKHLTIPAALALALLITGPVCAEDKKEPAAAAAVANLDGQAIKGKVLESMDAAGYTYMHVDASQGKVWVAIPQSKIEVGQEIAANPGMTMTQFEAKTLGRTFDVIVFSSGLVTAGNAAAGKAMAADPHKGLNMEGAMMGGVPTAMTAGSGGSSTAIVPAAEVKVEKATGDNAQTVEECFANGEKLNDKKVQVKGKVMKVSKMIMGRNWIHIQDGTGNPMKNTHDLVVTSQDAPEQDSIVVVEGVLHANKDFGANYKYDVIIEDAVIK